MAILTRGYWKGHPVNLSKRLKAQLALLVVDELPPKLQQLRDEWTLSSRPHVDDELKQINASRHVYVHIQLHSRLLPNGLQAHPTVTADAKASQTAPDSTFNAVSSEGSLLRHKGS